MDGFRKSILRRAVGGIIDAIGRFSDDVGVLPSGPFALFVPPRTVLAFGGFCAPPAPVVGFLQLSGGLVCWAFLLRGEDPGT